MQSFEGSALRFGEGQAPGQRGGVRRSEFPAEHGPLARAGAGWVDVAKLSEGAGVNALEAHGRMDRTQSTEFIKSQQSFFWRVLCKDAHKFVVQARAAYRLQAMQIAI